MRKTSWREVPATEAAWIAAATEAFDPTAPWHGCRVAQVAPAGFAACVKVLDFAWEDTVIPDFRGSRERWRTQVLEYDVLLPDLVPGCEGRRGFPYGSARVQRTRWSRLAAQFGLTVHPEFSSASFLGRTEDGGRWPARIIQPREGTLCEPAFTALISALPTADELCFHWDARKMLRGGHTTSAILLAGPAGTLPQNWPPRVDLMPSHIWPAGRDWVVVMDHELDFALVACGRELAQALLLHAELECLAVEPQHRVDAEADTLNH